MPFRLERLRENTQPRRLLGHKGKLQFSNQKLGLEQSRRKLCCLFVVVIENFFYSGLFCFETVSLVAQVGLELAV